MRLLVSLRSAEEVNAALAGGADIIDAKEPGRGPLGPVAPDVLRAISARVPSESPFSAALGDFTAAFEIGPAIEAATVSRTGAVYLKLGFAGAPNRASVDGLIATALRIAADLPGAPIVVPVAYADRLEAGTPSPEDVLDSAIARGARAFLMDTYTKDGTSLLDLLPLERVRALAGRARSAGLLVALAGSLGPAEVERLAGTADIVGVRGAACVGGRAGRLDASRIAHLRSRMSACSPATAHSGRGDVWQNARATLERGL
jgi:(5-formylfuran-3-yl)methyl phosphate synthase